jgi:hypothetical protein
VVTSHVGTARLATNEVAFAPRAGLAWDATGDGRTWVRASSSRRVAADQEAAARLGAGSPVARRCKWNYDTNAYDKECTLSGGDAGVTLGLPCGPSGLGADGRPCRARLDLPVSWEHTLGAGRTLGDGTSLDLDVVYRRTSGLPAQNETNRIWNNAGAGLGKVTGAYRSGRAETISDWSPRPDEYRRYLGVTASLQRQKGQGRFLLAYTWSRLESTLNLSAANSWGDIPGRAGPIVGYDPDDRRHSFRALGSYDVFGFASIAAVYAFDTGQPYDRLFYNPEVGGYDLYKATRGINPGANVNDPADDRALRSPSRQHLNLQLRVRLKRLTGIDLDLYGDAFELLVTRPNRAADTSDFGTPPEAPRFYRLGVAYRY